MVLDDVDLDMDIDESKLAMLSGIGFVLLAVYYVFVIWPITGFLWYGILLLLFSLMFPLFFYLDEMSFAPTSLSDTGAKFLAGIVFMLLVVIIALVFKYQPDYWIHAIGEVLIGLPSTMFFLHSVAGGI